LRMALWCLSVPQEEQASVCAPERNVSVISLRRFGENFRQVNAHVLPARTCSSPMRPKRCQTLRRNSWSVSRRSAVEGTVERKRPAPCCEDCEMLHLTSRGRELLRVKATVALRCRTGVKERWEWRPVASGKRAMLGTLVVESGVGASVMAWWMCCVRQSCVSARSVKN